MTRARLKNFVVIVQNGKIVRIVGCSETFFRHYPGKWARKVGELLDELLREYGFGEFNPSYEMITARVDGVDNLRRVVEQEFGYCYQGWAEAALEVFGGKGK